MLVHVAFVAHQVSCSCDLIFMLTVRIACGTLSPMARKSPFPPKTDFFTKHGAEMLRQHITSYWQARGFLGVRVERFQMPGRIDWGVRSNLVDGIPPTRARR